MRFLLSAIFYFPITISMAQTSPEMRFHKISDEVLQGVDMSIFKTTKDGLLWFGSNKGLASFDGSEMVYYGNKGLTTNTPYRLVDLCEDNQGNLWIITPEYGPVFFNRHSGVFKKIDFSINQKITSAQIHFAEVYVDRQGLVWISTGDRGFFTYDPQTNLSHHYNLNPAMPEDWESQYENTVRYFLQDRKFDNIIWIAGYGSGLFSFNKKTKQIKNDFKNSDKKFTFWRSKCITGIFQINDSIIWFPTWGYGMGEYNINTGYYKCFLRNSDDKAERQTYGHILNYAAQKSDSEFYVAPRDTIPAIFNINTKRYTFIKDAALDREEYERTLSVQTGANNLVYYQKGGSLFISSPQFNLCKTIKLKKMYSSVFPELRCVIWEKSNQRYYAGIQWGAGVNEYDSNFNLIREIPIPHFTNASFTDATTVWKLHRDKANHLWALGYITSVDDSASRSFIPVKKKWPQLQFLDSAMHGVAEAKNGMLYFNSFNNELIELDPFSLTEKIIPLPGNKDSGNFFTNDYWVLSDTLRNYIYFTANNNFYQYNTLTKKFRRLYLDSSYHANPMKKHSSSYTLDTYGFIWVSSPDHYLWKINPDNFKISDTIKFTNSYVDINGARLYGAYNDYLLISTYKSQLMFNTKNNQCTILDVTNGLFAKRSAYEMVCNNHVFFGYSGMGKAQYASLATLLQNSKNLIPYISSILVNNQPYISDVLPQYLKKLLLNYFQNSISIAFSTIEAALPNRLEYAYKLDNTGAAWSYTNNANRRINYADLSPGNYVFRVKVREWGLGWSPETTLAINITPPFWKTWWFISLIVLSLIALAVWLVQWRINSIRKQEHLRSKHEKELLELEAKALRAQMNPHFIFNCLNSIKSLIQQNNQDSAVMYLTTFSKLIRTIFQNSDKREITLYDEIETCKLYTQLEGMRFGKKLNYHFNVDDSIDLKSVKVPALIIQPFIENAIWHGIMPKEKEGTVNVSIEKRDDAICCIIDDDGIGREMSMQNKFKGEPSNHQSKGIRLTQSRLDLDNALNKRNATVLTTDKKVDSGKAKGTRVVITFKEF